MWDNDRNAYFHQQFRTIHHEWQLLGYEQRFQNGFDNQGLWVEVSVEKEKGFKSKKDIETYGIDKFVEDCKKSTYICKRDENF